MLVAEREHICHHCKSLHKVLGRGWSGEETRAEILAVRLGPACTHGATDAAAPRDHVDSADACESWKVAPLGPFSSSILTSWHVHAAMPMAAEFKGAKQVLWDMVCTTGHTTPVLLLQLLEHLLC